MGCTDSRPERLLKPEEDPSQMAKPPRNIVVCSCEDTMVLDARAIQKGCDRSTVTTARDLCRTQIEVFRAALAADAPLTVGCTQETPLFEELASEGAHTTPIVYANVRETAGWSRDGRAAGPKMAALLAAAAEVLPAAPAVTIESDGALLIYGCDERAVEAGNLLLTSGLDITVLLKPPARIGPPRRTDFPVVRGTVRTAKGNLGAFELIVDQFAHPSPSSRGELSFQGSRDGAKSQCDIIIDITGGAPLFSAPDLREGYLRAHPDDEASVLKVLLKARDLVGTFEKPRYITFDDGLCAHARSRITGCTRCLGLCPTGAITPAGNRVAIDAGICAGCGQCAAVCPTGAASYALPPADALMRKLRTLLATFHAAGGAHPIVLFHDEGHGATMIDALARHSDGLPANVLPVAVNEVTQIGLETLAAAFAYGAVAARVLLRARPRHDVTGLVQTMALTEAVISGLGFGADRIATVETDDPDALGAALRSIPDMQPAPATSEFMPTGAKRGVLRFALRELYRVAPQPVDVVPLPAGAPFGAVQIDAEGCTLCHACVSACPTGALTDDPDRPLLRFAEDACVQCGLCKATCPEKVISLQPQLDFRAATAPARILKEEEPFCCVRCGKPFGVRSSIDRVAAKLAGQHWMYKDAPGRLEVIKMCDDCRVAVISEQDFDPYGSPPRAPVRTTEDYLRERDKAKGEE